jgi:UDP-3-O-[3-hydroxymyristoyl] N-acetylglucosamine deacetylase
MRWLRKTLKDSVKFEGLGLHTGRPLSAAVHPSASGGIVFRCKGQSLSAVAENVTDTRRCTQLGPVVMVEHLMCAFSILGITDAVVEAEDGEMPALDGSAEAYAQGLLAVGWENLGEAEGPDFFKRALVREGDAVCAVSAGEGRWSYRYVTPGRWPEDQRFEAAPGADLLTEVAPARTFAFAEEVDAMRAAGLGLGLSAETCLVLGPEGPVNAAKFPDEPARHKLLDLIGDMALTGLPRAAFNVSAERTGHRMNVAAALKVRQLMGAAPI